MKSQVKRPEAYYEGYADFFAGRLDNRYRAKSQYFKEWEAGFNSAYFDNLKNIAESA